jgi:hypothetical protein
MPQFELKPISPAGVGVALQRAERYRLLKEPALAESICLDVLRIEPENQRALVTLLLAITDQFGEGALPAAARELLPRLKSDYEQSYFAGIIWERSAHAQLRSGAPNAAASAYRTFLEAMQRYEDAIELRPQGNDDAILRWNTCARILMRHPDLQPVHAAAHAPARRE